MTRWQLALKSLLWHGRSYIAVTACIATTCAVICGALLVGGSVKESLKNRALERLGQVELALVSGKFFREELAGELNAGSSAVPMILLQGSVRHSGNSRRASRVNIIGVDQRFNAVGRGLDSQGIGFRESRINSTLAEELSAQAGDELLVSFESFSDIPREHALGGREDASERIRLSILAVDEDSGTALFDLKLQQETPRNIFVSLDRLQKALGRKGEVNAIVVCRESAKIPSLGRLEESLAKAVRLEDLGAKLRLAEALGYFALESRDFLLGPHLVKAAKNALNNTAYLHQEVLTYLANSISVKETGREIPYSLVTGVGPWLQPGGVVAEYPLSTEENQEAWQAGRILLNSWALDDLGAQIGNRIVLKYFAMDVDHEVIEKTAEFELRGSVPLAGRALDPGWTPEYPGVSDAGTFADWDPPFPIDHGKIREPGPDGDYWKQYKTTPKAFISITEGKRLWKGKYGQLTSIRFRDDKNESGEAAVDDYTSRLLSAITPADFGLSFRPVRSEAIEASGMGTDFGMLFISMSFFIIAAGLMLTSMTLRLCLEGRVRNIGMLGAIGFTVKESRGLLAREVAISVVLGIAFGVIGGIAYAGFLIHGLRTWWEDAVNAPFLSLYISSEAIAISAGVTFILIGFTGFAAIRKLTSISPRRLLSGEASAQLSGSELAHRGRKTMFYGALLLAAACMSLVGSAAGYIAPVTGFLLAGFTMLLGSLFLFSSSLQRGTPGTLKSRGGLALLALGIRNGKRAGSRSLLTAGLIACATFIVVTVAAFQQDPVGGEPEVRSGDGGFAFVGRSSLPLYSSLQTPGGRMDLGIDETVGQKITGPGTAIYALRERPGDETSCLNLYRPVEPRILGVPGEFIERGGFSWAGSLAETPEEEDNPWKLLNRQDLPAGVVPAIGDQNTVRWILHSGLGQDIVIRDGAGRELALRIVGLLSNSLLQGALVVGAPAFEEMFPARGGWSTFFIQAPQGNRAFLRESLERELVDYGFDLRSSGEILSHFNRVQNTYLSTFMMLGGLGLLIGTIGLAAVLLRNVNDRRGELALMRALGFSRRAIACTVIAETTFLLVLGEFQGTVAALVATAPTLASTHSRMHWGALGTILLIVLCGGFLSCIFALKAALKTPVLGALRSE